MMLVLKAVALGISLVVAGGAIGFVLLLLLNAAAMRAHPLGGASLDTEEE